MKRIFLVLALVLSLGGVARGQAALLVLIFGEKAASENFYFSLKAGLNYSMINGNEDGKNRMGLNFGLINNIRINDKLYLAPEFIALSPRGTRDVPVLTTGNPDLDSLLSGDITTDRKLSYIDIPILLNYKLSKRWSISTGPQISYLSKAYDIYQTAPLDGTVLKTEIDIREEIRRWDMAWIIDVSYMVSEAKAGKGMNLYLRFGQGLLSMISDSSGKKFYNTTLQFGASFPFIDTGE